MLQWPRNGRLRALFSPSAQAVYKGASINLASVLYNCMDSSVIDAGIQQARRAAVAGEAPSVVAKVVTALESMLQYQCQVRGGWVALLLLLLLLLFVWKRDRQE